MKKRLLNVLGKKGLIISVIALLALTTGTTAAITSYLSNTHIHGETCYNEEDVLVCGYNDTTIKDEDAIALLKSGTMTKAQMEKAGIDINSTKIPLEYFDFRHPALLEGAEHEPLDLNGLVASQEGYENGITPGRINLSVPVKMDSEDDHAATYSYYQAHVKDTEVNYAGLLNVHDKVNGGSTTYVYYVSDETLDDMTVYSILRPGEKITVDYSNETTHTIDYEFADYDSKDVKNDGPGGKTIRDIFGEDRTNIVAQGEAVKISVEIPRGYYAVAKLYRDENRDGSFDKDNVFETAVLGEMKSYKQDVKTAGNGSEIYQVDENGNAYDGETVYTAEFSSLNVQYDALVSLEWKKNDTYKFDASMWEKQVYAHNRIAPIPSNAGYTGNFKSKPDNGEAGSFTWKMKGKTSDGYTWEMDQLEINGTPINVPTTTLDNPPGEDADSRTLPSKTTVLPTGTVIEISITDWQGDNGKNAYRDYEIKASNCYENLTITGGNMVSHSHKEVAMDKLSGVASPQFYSHWKNGAATWGADAIWAELSQNSLMARAKTDGDHRYTDPIRFKRHLGYHGKANITLTDKNGSVLQKNGEKGTLAEIPENSIEYLVLEQSKVVGYGFEAGENTPRNPNPNGYMRGTVDCFTVVTYEDWTASYDGNYYFRMTKALDDWMRKTNKDGVVLLSIEGEPIKGAIDYVSGTGRENAPAAENITNMPSVDLGGDTGYNCEENDHAIVSMKKPRDKNGEYVFEHWEVLAVNYTDQSMLEGTTLDEAFTVKNELDEDEVVTYEAGEQVEITGLLQSELAGAFCHKDYVNSNGDKVGRAAITLRAVWKHVGLKDSIDYNVFYYIDGQEIHSATHLVPEGSIAVTDLYKSDGSFATGLQNILNGNNYEGVKYTDRYLVDTANTTMVLEDIDKDSNTAYIRLVTADTDIDVVKQWDVPKGTDKQPVKVQLQHQHRGSDNWHAVPEQLLGGKSNTVELNKANNWSYEFKKVPKYEGDDLTKPYEYRIAELDAQGNTIVLGSSVEIDGHDYIVSYDRTDDEDGRHVRITNNYLSEASWDEFQLILGKQITGAASKNKDYTFNLTIPKFANQEITVNTAAGVTEKIKFDGEGKATVSLKSGNALIFPAIKTESFFEDIPVRIEEKLTNEEQEYYTTKVRYSMLNASGTPDYIDGNIFNENSHFPGSNLVIFTNHRNAGDLTVTKELAGNDASASREWHFKVELNEKDVNGVYGDMTFINGVAEVTILGKGSKTAVGLPEGVKYKVSEYEAGWEGYNTDKRVTGNTSGNLEEDGVTYDGVIKQNLTSTVKFTNFKAKVERDFIVSKNLDGNAAVGGGFSFELRFLGEAGSDLSSPEGEGEVIETTTNTDSTAKFSMKYGREDIGKTYVYTVKEKQGNDDAVIYDDTEYKLWVKVSQPEAAAGAFNTNNYEAKVVKAIKIDGGNATEINYDSSPILQFNNTSRKDAVVNLNVTKELQGRSWLEDEEFEFKIQALNEDGTLAPDNHNIPMPENTNVSVGKPPVGNTASVTFGPIAYDKAGTYKYKITEVKGNAGGMTYASNEAIATVNVTATGENNFEATTTITNDKFVNSYNTTLNYGAKGGLSLIKNLTGHDLHKDKFEFEITAADVLSAQKAGINGAEYKTTVKNEAALQDASGVATRIIPLFSSMTFTNADEGKVYEYKIKEVIPEPAEKGYTYDNEVYTVRIETEDDDAGILKVKTTVTNKAGESKTYTYANNADTEENGRASVTFNNKYNAEGKVTIEAEKVISNRLLNENDFTFVITDVKGNEVARATNKAASIDSATGNATAKINFPELAYDVDKLNKDVEAGIASKTMITEGVATPRYEYTYRYTVSEVTSSLIDGVSPVVSTHNILVKLTDDCKGNLEPQVTYPEGSGSKLTFTNTFQSKDSVSVELSGSKILTGEAGAELPDIDGKYEFTLEAVTEGAPMPDGSTGGKKTVTNKTANVNFGLVTFAGKDLQDAGWEENQTMSKTYEYKVTESGSVAGVTNDSDNEKTFEVTLTGDGQGNLTVSTTPASGALFTFTNTYKAGPTTSSPTGTGNLTITKELTGRSLNANEFEFKIEPMMDYGSAVNMPAVTTAKNAENGKVEFGEIKFHNRGSYEFRISEINNNLAGITYDDTVYTATATVLDNGTGGFDITWALKQHNSIAVGDTETVQQEPENKAIVFKNSYTPSPATVQLGAYKNKNADRNWGAGEFTFQVKDKTGAVIAEAQNDRDGNVRFKDLTFDKAGTYEYTISEVAGDNPTITYDNTEYNVTIEVTDSLNGYLEAQVTISGTENQGGIVQFTNGYTPTADEVELGSLTKILTGGRKAPLQADEFYFHMSLVSASVEDGVELEGDNNDVGAILLKNDAEGNVDLGSLKFKKAGTYIFHVQEAVPVGGKYDPTITYDNHLIRLAYTVRDNNGKFEAELTAANGDRRFTNVYGAVEPATANIDVYKILEGRDWTDEDEFSFTIEPIGSDIDVSDRTESGPEAKAGSASENIGEQEGVNAGASVELKNSIPMPAITTVAVDKDDVEKGKAKATFGKITYSKAGKYYYRITENKATFGSAPYKEDGVSYSQNVAVATVTVSDNGEGAFVAEVNVNEPNFTNIYRPAYEVSTPTKEEAIKITKQLNGRELEVNEFEFKMKYDGEDVDAVTMPTPQKPNAAGSIIARNDEDGKVSFSNIRFNKAGKFEFELSEIIPEDDKKLSGVTYDKSKYTLVADVSDDNKGKLSVRWSVEDNIFADGEDAEKGTIVFTNNYEAAGTEAVIKAHKTYRFKDKDIKLQGGEFTFRLADEDGEVIAETENDAGGNIVFEQLKFDKAGEYKYTVSEVKGEDENVVYDESTYEVVVKVTDNLRGSLEAEVEVDGQEKIEFVNTNTKEDPYAPPKPDDPDSSKGDGILTGDSSNILLYALAAITAAAVAAVSVLYRRKKE